MPNTPEELKSGLSTIVKQYYNDPVGFVKGIFKVNPTEQQAAVLKSLAQSKKVSCRAGHGVGKSALASWAVYWFLLTRPFPKIICTAPTFHQLHDVLWAELSKWRRNSALITEAFEWTQKRIEAKWAKTDWFAAARTPEKAEGFQGRHAGHILLIVDEASGISQEIFEASEGMLTGENSYVLLLGNPTKNSGYFYDSHNRDKDFWATHVLPCHDSPLVHQDYIDDMAGKWGVDSNVYRVRVLGEFPDSEEDVLIPRDWVISAVNRDIQPQPNDPVTIGVDVARGGGDYSVILIRKGNKVLSIDKYNYPDTMSLTGTVMEAVHKWKPSAVFVDVIGVGAGVYDRLRENGVAGVYPVNVSESAGQKHKYFRMRDELWHRTRELFEQRIISIPDDKELVDELSMVKVLAPDSAGRLKVESKKQMKTRGEQSPNKADALCLTNYFKRTAVASMGQEKQKELKHIPLGIV